MLSIDPNALDRVLRGVVESGSIAKIIEEMPQKKEESFIDSEDKIATMKVDVLPDYTIGQEEMHEYGYKWDGMLPMRERTAKMLFGMGVPISALYESDTESEVDTAEGIKEHDGLFGVEKPDWQAFIQSEEGKAYLSARYVFCESLGTVLKKEFDFFPAEYTDGLSDNNYDEKKALKRYLEVEGLSESDEMKRYVEPLLDDYTKRFYPFPLEKYGWELGSVTSVLAKELTNDELRDEAKRIVEERRLHGFIDLGLESIEWLNGRQFNKDEIADIVADLKPHFERSEYDGGFRGRAFDEYYDEFAEESIVPYLESKAFDVDAELEKEMDSMTAEEASEFLGQENGGIDYSKIVIDRVTEEFDRFRDDLINQPALNVFHKNYEIHVKTELYEVITEGSYLSEEQYKELSRERGDILTGLYQDFLSNEFASVNNYGETADFIKEYIEYHRGEKAVYFGMDTEDTGYWWQKEGHLSNDSLVEITEKADNYVIAADALALSEAQLEEKHISFLKVGSDISEEDLKDMDHAIDNMQRAVQRKRKQKSEAYRERMRQNVDCKREIERVISKNFDGMHLKEGCEDEVLEGFALTEVVYVLANTIQEKAEDGRFSKENKEWAKETEITEMPEHRYQFVVDSHPAVLDGFIDLIREKEKQEKKNKEETMPTNENEQNKKKWVTVTTAEDARIKEYEHSTLMRMPTSGEYAGYTYFIFNDRIRRSTQITDLQSDSRELAVALRFKEGDTILIRDRENDKEVELTLEQFTDLVGGKTNKDYIRVQESNEKKWTTINVPSEAMLGSYENSSLFATPNNSEFKNSSFYVPNAFISEDSESEDERLRISVPDEFEFTVKNKENGTVTKLSAHQIFRMMNRTEAEAYEREHEKAAAPKEDNGWRYVAVDQAAMIAEYDDSTLFRMPNGEYEGYCYYIPNNLVRENEEKGTYRISLPKEFTVNLLKRNAEKEEEKKIGMSAEMFIEQVRGKEEEDYPEYQKPSESKRTLFIENRKKLIENVPQEMRDRPNWVVVRTKYNEEKDKVEKYLINPHTGEFAESDNPETWADFETASKYAKGHGGVTLAYALDGKDGICCIDLDHCIDENGNVSKTAETVLNATKDCYCEKSVSGKGYHILGKTEGLDIRAFSKNRESEFYQKNQFISMTGDVQDGRTELRSIDKMPVREYLVAHHEKREELRGAGKGVEGLSIMSDRDVVEKAIASKGGETFRALYSGQDLQGNHSNSDMSLMNRLAFWCNGDCEQMLRIFATSGLYRESKSPSYYEHTAIKAIRDTTTRFQPKPKMPMNNKPVGNGSGKGGK